MRRFYFLLVAIAAVFTLSLQSCSLTPESLVSRLNSVCPADMGDGVVAESFALNGSTVEMHFRVPEGIDVTAFSRLPESGIKEFVKEIKDDEPAFFDDFVALNLEARAIFCDPSSKCASFLIPVSLMK